MKLRKLFAWLMTLVMLLGMVPTAQAEVINCDHNWAWRWPNGQPVNCQDWKWSEKYCTKCGVGDGGFEQCGPCVPGDKTWVIPQASNCQEHGVWEITCKHCGEWLEGMEEPGPHKWSETIVEQPWCDVGGMKAMICSVCGEWQNNGTPLNPLGHDWGSWSWAHGSAPSCTEGAWQVRNCNRCGQMEDKWVEAGSHQWGSWNTVSAGNCQTPAKEQRSCSVCGATESRNGDKGKHQFSSWWHYSDPTCTEKGWNYRKCSVCGEEEWKSIDPVDHVFGEWHVIEEPQVGIPGTERRACIYNCGTHEDREIPALEEALKLPGLGLELTLDSTPANGEYFVVGEKVVFTASWVNNSSETLLPFYVSIWPYEQPSRDSQDLPYSCSFDAEEPITPGMTGSHSMVTTVTEEDVARGGIYAMAYIWSSVHNGPEVEEVTTPFVTAPCGAEGASYATSIELEVLDVPSVTAEWAGDVYTAKVKVTNTGDTTISLYAYQFSDSNNEYYPNAIKYSWNKYQDDPRADWLHAGESLTTDIEFAVTQDGIAAGELRFSFTQFATPWYAVVNDVETNIPAVIVAEPEGTTGYYGKRDEAVTDTVEIVVPINQGEDESAAEGLTVTKTASAGDYSNPCKPGDVVTFTITVTNNTGEVLTDVEITDPIKGGNEDAVLDRIASMQPGESVTASFSYTVTEEDATVGVEGFENTAYATGYTADGTQVSGTSETIFVWCVFPHELSISKTVSGTPANGEFYVPGETICFIISMANDTPYPLYNVVLTDPLCEDQYFNDEVNGMSYLYMDNFDSGDDPQGYSSAQVAPTYVVTEADAEAGFVTNTAMVHYQTWDGEEKTASASFTVKCGKAEDDGDMGLSSTLNVTKSVTSTPANGNFYVPGETVTFNVHVVNTGDPLNNLHVSDWMWAQSLAFGTINTNEDVSFPVSYTVTELDAITGSVSNIAFAEAVAANGDPVMEYSNDVTVSCGFPEGEDPFGILTGLEITKAEESLPLNGSYYTEGETVAYKITYTNIGEMPLTDVIIYDAMGGMSEIATAETLNPSESRVCWFNHTVTAVDVSRGYISNTAVGQFELNGWVNTASSNTVTVDTNGKQDLWTVHPFWPGEDPEYDPGTGWFPDSDPALEGDTPPFGTIDTDALHSGETYCVRTITDRDNVSVSYETGFCAVHGPVQASALLMQQAATTPEMQVQAAAYATALWRSEVEKIYQELMAAADPTAQAVLMTEYIRFVADIANYEAMLKVLHPDQPALAAVKVAEIWENKCIDLCYDTHAVADERKDSLLAVTPTTGAAAVSCTCEVTAQEADRKAIVQRYCAMHGFPFSMTDALLRGNDTADAWTMVRQIWGVELTSAYNKLCAAMGENKLLAMAEQHALTQWMMAREASLIALYPDNPEVVVQLMTKLIMARVNELCQMTN